MPDETMARMTGAAIADAIHLSAHLSWSDTIIAKEPYDVETMELLESVYVAGYIAAARDALKARLGQ